MKKNTVRITLDTGNDAFADGRYGREVAELLRDAAARIENGQANFKLYDNNGNPVGKVENA